MERINKAKAVFWTILGIAAAVGITRFIFGLGVTTNMTDNTPWGFWIGFDVMGGVALAGGGFVIAAINYIFGREEFHPISRAAILTAFLGYLAVAVGLLFDLGLPWNIWHMIIFWNPHSPLFEVGWCVMLYLTVLFLEFAPVIFERWPKIKILNNLYKLLNKVKIPIVILGIMLSTLHQSSLGSLFLAMPYKLHPIWYSPIMPIIFFVSAICLGLMMVMVESMSTSWLYKKEPETKILNKLSKYAIIMLLIYAVLKFSDIFARGADEFLFSNTWETFLFWLETLIMVVIPVLVFSIGKLRSKINWLYFAAFSGVFGVVFNRLNVGGITHINNIGDAGGFYLPSLTEIFISAGVVSAAVLVFFYFIENYKVWEEKPVDPTENPKVKPRFGSHMAYFGPTKDANRSRFSFLFVVAFGITFASISGSTISNNGYEQINVKRARGGDTLTIDGNRDGYAVAFKHEFHKQAGISCASCHHMNKPGDEATGCYECHTGMYTEGDAFGHDWHASGMGANKNCFECHDESVSKGKGFIKSINNSYDLCKECHEGMFSTESAIEYPSFKTASYTNAMHGLCIKCHENSLNANPELKARKPQLAQCSNCHANEGDFKNKAGKFKDINKWVNVPKK